MKINKIKGYRNMCNLTGADMAKLLGVTKMTYSRKENGRSAFSDKEKVLIRDLFNAKLCQAFTIDELFF